MSKKSNKTETEVKAEEVSAPIVIPKIRFQGETKKHAMELLFSNKDVPTITSVGCVRIPETNSYISFVMKTKGKEVVSVEVDEPNLRAIAEEAAKIDFVNNFMSGEM